MKLSGLLLGELTTLGHIENRVQFECSPPNRLHRRLCSSPQWIAPDVKAPNTQIFLQAAEVLRYFKIAVDSGGRRRGGAVARSGPAERTALALRRQRLSAVVGAICRRHGANWIPFGTTVQEHRYSSLLEVSRHSRLAAAHRRFDPSAGCRCSFCPAFAPHGERLLRQMRLRSPCHAGSMSRMRDDSAEMSFNTRKLCDNTSCLLR